MSSPIPWEDRSRPFVGRFVATLLGVFRPLNNAPSFAHGKAWSGWAFAVLTFVPLALLWGIVPFTHQLLFEAGFGLRVVADTTSASLLVDLARASLLSLAYESAKLVALTLPFYSLCNAFGDGGPPAAPLRMMTYRAWLIPLSAFLVYFIGWATPLGADGEANQTMVTLLQLLEMIPLLYLIWSMSSTSRMASGVGPLMTLPVVLIPFALFYVVQLLMGTAITPLLPDSETLRAAAGLIPQS